jgi:DNA modification methylase
MTLQLEKGDCLELMKKIPAKSIDLMICDLPYGELNCSWDSIIEMDEFWKQFKRIRKTDRVACIHFCSTKFGYTLIKSWEKGYKMDMVWKKRNKTGGLQSKHRPMRNHEMVYFFYDKAPKYNRDKYHKRINQHTLKYEKPKDGQEIGVGGTHKMEKGFKLGHHFEPPNPSSVVNEVSVIEYKRDLSNSTRKGKDVFGNNLLVKNKPFNYEPPNPVSVIEEEVVNQTQTSSYTNGFQNSTQKGTDVFGNLLVRNKPFNYEPTNPVSVIEEEVVVEEKNIGLIREDLSSTGWNWEYLLSPENPRGPSFDPVLPGSTFESDRVFVGKRHHQTEKPLDMLEFFLKYWSDEGDTVLDPTMGSGSTGVACKKMGRNFIGFELNDKIYENAKKRIEKGK